MPDALPPWVLGLVIPISLGIGAFLWRSFFGLNFLQQANDKEADRLISMGLVRIAHLEAEVTRLEGRVQELDSEVTLLLTQIRTEAKA